MTSIAKISTGLLMLLVTAPNPDASEGGKRVDVKPETVKIEWYAEKVTGSHNGLVNLQKGFVWVENGALTGGEFTVDMTTISVTDLSGMWKNKLEKHLKSEDFFDVENHPTSHLVIKKIEKDASGKAFTHRVTADLTIKGITKEVVFPAKIVMQDNKLAVYAEVTVNRTAYDITYKSPSIFNDLGDKAIMDEFTIKVSFGALI